MSLTKCQPEKMPKDSFMDSWVVPNDSKVIRHMLRVVCLGKSPLISGLVLGFGEARGPPTHVLDGMSVQDGAQGRGVRLTLRTGRGRHSFPLG